MLVSWRGKSIGIWPVLLGERELLVKRSKSLELMKDSAKSWLFGRGICKEFPLGSGKIEVGK